MKKGLVLVLIAVVSAGLLFTGCNTGTDGTETPAPAVSPGGVVVDKTVSNETELAAALADPKVDVIAFVMSADVSASGTIIIPAGKTVYLLTTATSNETTLTPVKGLEIRGTLIVSESTVLAAESTGKVYLGSSGSLRIQDGGQLSTDKRKSVSNLTDAGVGEDSVLGTVRYAGGSGLTITNEPALTVADIGEILGYLTAGVAPSRSVANSINGPSWLDLKAKLTEVKPSDIALIPNISAARNLGVTPVATEPATTTAITIPAGAWVTIEQALPQIKTLVVDGWAEAPSIGNGTDAVTVTVSAGANLEVADDIKFAPASKIATGGSFKGSATADSVIIADAGAVVNGTEVIEGDGVVVVGGTFPATTESGKTYLIAGTVSVDAKGVNLVDGATLRIPEGSTLNGPGEVTGAGTIILEGGWYSQGAGIAYSLDDTTGYNPGGLTAGSSEKNLKAKTTTIYLSGTVENEITEFAKNNIWADAGSGKPAGNWSWATIVGILPAGTIGANSGIEIKQTNLSLLYYKGSKLVDVAQTVTEKPTASVTITTEGPASIHLDPKDAWAIKWATYGTGRSPQDGKGFGILLWSGAKPQTATIETTPKDGTLYTTIVDWSGVKFTNP
jgi:hypothetical protein